MGTDEGASSEAVGVETEAPSPQSPHQDDPAPAIEGYAMGPRVGSGGMGVVFRAVDSSQRDVALKVMRADAASRTAAARFQREVEVLAQVEHPGIVRYVAHGVSQRSEPYLVMEWVDGEDLATHSITK